MIVNDITVCGWVDGLMGWRFMKYGFGCRWKEIMILLVLGMGWRCIMDIYIYICIYIYMHIYISNKSGYIYER